MRIVIIIVRVLMGLLLLFASLNYFFHFVAEPQQTGAMKVFSDGITASVYLMPLVKVVELLCGLSLVSGKFLKLFAIVLIPITLNILLINVYLMPSGIPIAGTLFLGNLVIVYSNWSSYKNLFTA